MVTQQPGRSGQHGISFLEVKESRFWDNIVSLLILQPKQVMTINPAPFNNRMQQFPFCDGGTINYGWSHQFQNCWNDFSIPVPTWGFIASFHFCLVKSISTNIEITVPTVLVPKNSFKT